MNGQIKIVPEAGAVFLLSYADDQPLKFLNAVGNSAPTFIGGLTLATGGTASTLALFGGGYAHIQQAFPSLHVGDSLTLLSFDQHGNFVKARNSNAAHLIPNKFALSYGSGNGLILGVTYNQTTTLFGDTLSNEGLEDIAIMKYATNDTLKWGELYGTTDNESVSKMMYDAQGIAYFAGEFSGSQEVRMIGNYIFTDTTGLPTQRVYLSYVIDTIPSVQNTTAELTAIEHPVAISKTPAIADAVQSLGVFPNPFTNQTTVICTTTEAGQYTLVVQNELGKVVSQQSLQLGLGQNSQVLSTQQFTPGFYYLTLRNAKGKVVGAQKLIKQ